MEVTSNRINRLDTAEEMISKLKDVIEVIKIKSKWNTEKNMLTQNEQSIPEYGKTSS